MKTYVPKPSEIRRDWVLIDAKGKVLGRLASQVASLLRGKHKPTFTPNVDMGDFVVVINAADIVLTGQKCRDKIHYWHTGYVGHIRSVTYGDLLTNNPEKMLLLAVKRMLASNKLQKRFLRKLKVFPGTEHHLVAQRPKQIGLPKE